MDRREFAARLVLIALAASSVIRAQPARRVYRIGVLGLGTTSDMAGAHPNSPSIRALIGGMRDLGYKYGEHYVTEPRGAAGSPDRFPTLAAELVRLNVDVILAGGGPAVPALKQATTTIPIVMAASGDPVVDGYVQSLARPGGNITGLSLQSIETTVKRLDLLKQLVPGPAPVAVFWNGPSIQAWRAAEAIARERGVEAPVCRDSRSWRNRCGLQNGERWPCECCPCVRRRRPLPASPASSGASREERAPRYVRTPAVRRRRWIDIVRSQYHPNLATSSGVCRQDHKGRKTERSADRTANKVRVGDQS